MVKEKYVGKLNLNKVSPKEQHKNMPKICLNKSPRKQKSPNNKKTSVVEKKAIKRKILPVDASPKKKKRIVSASKDKSLSSSSSKLTQIARNGNSIDATIEDVITRYSQLPPTTSIEANKEQESPGDGSGLAATIATAKLAAQESGGDLPDGDDPASPESLDEEDITEFLNEYPDLPSYLNSSHGEDMLLTQRHCTESTINWVSSSFPPDVDNESATGMDQRCSAVSDDEDLRDLYNKKTECKQHLLKSCDDFLPQASTSSPDGDTQLTEDMHFNQNTSTQSEVLRMISDDLFLNTSPSGIGDRCSSNSEIDDVSYLKRKKLNKTVSQTSLGSLRRRSDSLKSPQSIDDVYTCSYPNSIDEISSGSGFGIFDANKKNTKRVKFSNDDSFSRKSFDSYKSNLSFDEWTDEVSPQVRLSKLSAEDISAANYGRLNSPTKSRQSPLKSSSTENINKIITKNLKVMVPKLDVSPEPGRGVQGRQHKTNEFIPSPEFKDINKRQIKVVIEKLNISPDSPSQPINKKMKPSPDAAICQESRLCPTKKPVVVLEKVKHLADIPKNPIQRHCQKEETNVTSQQNTIATTPRRSCRGAVNDNWTPEVCVTKLTNKMNASTFEELDDQQYSQDQDKNIFVSNNKVENITHITNDNMEQKQPNGLCCSNTVSHNIKLKENCINTLRSDMKFGCKEDVNNLCKPRKNTINNKKTVTNTQERRKKLTKLEIMKSNTTKFKHINLKNDTKSVNNVTNQMAAQEAIFKQPTISKNIIIRKKVASTPQIISSNYLQSNINNNKDQSCDYQEFDKITNLPINRFETGCNSPDNDNMSIISLAVNPDLESFIEEKRKESENDLNLKNPKRRFIPPVNKLSEKSPEGLFYRPNPIEWQSSSVFKWANEEPRSLGDSIEDPISINSPLVGTSFQGYCLKYLRTSINDGCSLRHEEPISLMKKDSWQRHTNEDEGVTNAIELVISKGFNNPPVGVLGAFVTFCIKANKRTLLPKIANVLKENISLDFGNEENAKRIWRCFIENLANKRIYTSNKYNVENKSIDNRHSIINGVLNQVFTENGVVNNKHRKLLNIILEILGAVSLQSQLQLLNCVQFLSPHDLENSPISFKLDATRLVLIKHSETSNSAKFAYRVYKSFYWNIPPNSEIYKMDKVTVDAFFEILEENYQIRNPFHQTTLRNAMNNSPTLQPGLSGNSSKGSSPCDSPKNCSELKTVILQHKNNIPAIVQALKHTMLSNKNINDMIDAFNSFENGVSLYMKVFRTCPEFIKQELRYVTLSFMLVKVIEKDWQTAIEIYQQIKNLNLRTIKTLVLVGAQSHSICAEDIILSTIQVCLKTNNLKEAIILFIKYDVNNGKRWYKIENWPKICEDIRNYICRLLDNNPIPDDMLENISSIVMSQHTLKTPIDICRIISTFVTKLMRSNKMHDAAMLIARIVYFKTAMKELQLDTVDQYRSLSIQMVKDNFENYLIRNLVYKACKKVPHYPRDIEANSNVLNLITSLSKEEMYGILITKNNLSDIKMTDQNYEISFQEPESSTPTIPELEYQDNSMQGGVNRLLQALRMMFSNPSILRKNSNTVTVDRISLVSADERSQMMNI